MNILILGPGAIGSLWATEFQLAGHQVSVWGRTSELQHSLALDDSPAMDFPNQ
ncbi:2-dehydropantoate 2-reductase, partial [Vibrio parahaemolyticus]|uniref:2-dehydropantoate 2-reductase N-terminal domain-containing protein n=1 Tax=Vibrio parahaemolyticus TaxID=670 RepID=UPI00062B06CB